MIREKQRSVSSGWGVFGILMAIDLAALYSIYRGVEANNQAWALTSITVAVLAALMYPGLFVVNPNEGKVLQLFGAYKGTVRQEGLRWANPLYTKKRVSLRIRNFESAKLEVNDYENYVHVQTESAVRNLATNYTYDTHDEEHVSLRGHTGAVAEHLKR